MAGLRLQQPAQNGREDAAELLIVFGDNPDRIRSEARPSRNCAVPVRSRLRPG